MKLDDLLEGKVVKRPSKIIKSPYVADIIPLTLDSDKQNEEILGHTCITWMVVG